MEISFENVVIFPVTWFGLFSIVYHVPGHSFPRVRFHGWDMESMDVDMESMDSDIELMHPWNDIHVPCNTFYATSSECGNTFHGPNNSFHFIFHTLVYDFYVFGHILNELLPYNLELRCSKKINLGGFNLTFFFMIRFTLPSTHSKNIRITDTHGTVVRFIKCSL